MFYATLVVSFKIGGLKRYFLGCGMLLELSYFVCPALVFNGGDAQGRELVHGYDRVSANPSVGLRATFCDGLPARHDQD